MRLHRAASRLRRAPGPRLRAHYSAPADGIADVLPDSEPSSSSTSESLPGVPAVRRTEWEQRQQQQQQQRDPESSQGSSGVPSSLSPTPLVAFPTPPFHTHTFFSALCPTFAEPVARSLMKATRALLVHRMDRLNGEMFNRKDFDNQAYLFRAALSELRTEMTMRTRNEFATLQSTTGQLRREAEALDGKMKEDIATLKNDLQLDIDNRKHDSRAELKTFEMAIEDLGNEAQISLSDIRTEIEQAKWHNTRRGLGLISAVGIIIVTVSELNTRERQREKDAKKRAKEAAAERQAEIA